MSAIHLEKWATEDDAMVIMHCGAVVFLADDGTPLPSDVDFVAPNWPQNATCGRCLLMAAGQSVASNACEVAA